MLLEQIIREPDFTSRDQKYKSVSSICRGNVIFFWISICLLKLKIRSLKCPCLEFSWGPSVFCPEHGVDCQELAWCPASETNFPCWSEINYSWSLHEALRMSAAVKGRWEERKWVYGLCWLRVFFCVCVCTSTDRIRYGQNNSAWPYYYFNYGHLDPAGL